MSRILGLKFWRTSKFLLCLCRLKALAVEPYSQAEAERASGMGSYIAPKRVAVKTQDISSEMELEDRTS